jgi:4-diphosphocytidyl-2-C-methyl-D-erythritol kinase
MIDLQKRIPIGAGLGGGSSDAGTVLRILAQVFRIDDSAKLRAVAVGVGADVPFFLEPAPSRVRGIGEQVERLPRFLPFELVLAVPPINVSTAEIFRALRPEQWSGPATHGSIMLLADGRLDPGLLVNDLAAVAMNKYPLINEMRLALNRAGAIGASMTGSGGAVFGIFASAPSADIAAAELGRQYREVDFLRAAVLPKVPV